MDKEENLNAAIRKAQAELQATPVAEDRAFWLTSIIALKKRRQDEKADNENR